MSLLPMMIRYGEALLAALERERESYNFKIIPEPGASERLKQIDEDIEKTRKDISRAKLLLEREQKESRVK